ncbi:hypothetical protein LXL04_015654 [Taraxacum kok-saghyz]
MDLATLSVKGWIIAKGGALVGTGATGPALLRRPVLLPFFVVVFSVRLTLLLANTVRRDGTLSRTQSHANTLRRPGPPPFCFLRLRPTVPRLPPLSSSNSGDISLCPPPAATSPDPFDDLFFTEQFGNHVGSRKETKIEELKNDGDNSDPNTKDGIMREVGTRGDWTDGAMLAAGEPGSCSSTTRVKKITPVEII